MFASGGTIFRKFKQLTKKMLTCSTVKRLLGSKRIPRYMRMVEDMKYRALGSSVGAKIRMKSISHFLEIHSGSVEPLMQEMNHRQVYIAKDLGKVGTCDILWLGQEHFCEPNKQANVVGVIRFGIDGDSSLALSGFRNPRSFLNMGPIPISHLANKGVLSCFSAML